MKHLPVRNPRTARIHPVPGKDKLEVAHALLRLGMGPVWRTPKGIIEFAPHPWVELVSLRGVVVYRAAATKFKPAPGVPCPFCTPDDPRLDAGQAKLCAVHARNMKPINVKGGQDDTD